MTDPALRIIPDSQLRFARPTLRAGGLSFTWPVGTEGFRRTGSAVLGLHKFIGDNAVHANVIHFDEGHIEMSGTFPGLSSTNNMVNLIDVLISRNKKVLYVPGVFPREQYVEVENYDFTHTADDRTHSIDYTVSFVKVGSGSSVGGFAETSLKTVTGATIKTTGQAQSRALGVGGLSVAPDSEATGPQAISRVAKSRSARYFRVVDGVDTFRMIAQMVYGDADRASLLVDLNQEVIANNNPGTEKMTHELIYTRWPRGTKIAY